MASTHDNSDTGNTAENKRKKFTANSSDFVHLSSKRMKLPEMEKAMSQESTDEWSCDLQNSNSFSSCDESPRKCDKNRNKQNNFISRHRLLSQTPSPPNENIPEFAFDSKELVNHITDSLQQSPDLVRKFMDKKSEAAKRTKSELENEGWAHCLAGFTEDQGHSEDLTYKNNRKSTNLIKEIIGSPATVTSPLIQPNHDNEYLAALKDLNSDVTFIDTHCHLDFLFKQTCFRKNSHLAYQKRHKSSYPQCYEGCVAIFCDPKTFKEDTWKQILAEDKVWAAFGCHPHNADLYDDEVEGYMKTALEHEKVVALGEIGLDYSSRNSSNHQKQKEVFRRQLKLARELDKPVVIHARNATKDTLEIMKEVLPSDYKIHRHCFTGSWAEAEIWLKEFTNLYLGLTNLVTFANVVELHEVAKKIPLDRLLLETDAPYFVPRLLSKDNKRSHPGMAIHVAMRVALLRSEQLETILKSTRVNTKNMYGI